MLKQFLTSLLSTADDADLDFKMSCALLNMTTYPKLLHKPRIQNDVNVKILGLIVFSVSVIVIRLRLMLNTNPLCRCLPAVIVFDRRKIQSVLYTLICRIKKKKKTYIDAYYL